MTQALPDSSAPEASAVLEFLLTRRSRPAAILKEPAPNHAELKTILTAAARVPDHGKLEPWRFIIVSGEARARLGALAERRCREIGVAEEKIGKIVAGFSQSPMMIAVVSSPKDTDRIPEWEQVLSAGAACVSLVNAALASGFGASWLTTAMAFDRVFVTEGLGLTEHERIAGYIHLGSTEARPPERPRPDIDAITSWLD